MSRNKSEKEKPKAQDAPGQDIAHSDGISRLIARHQETGKNCFAIEAYLYARNYNVLIPEYLLNWLVSPLTKHLNTNGASDLNQTIGIRGKTSGKSGDTIYLLIEERNAYAKMRICSLMHQCDPDTGSRYRQGKACEITAEELSESKYNVLGKIEPSTLMKYRRTQGWIKDCEDTVNTIKLMRQEGITIEPGLAELFPE